MIPDALLCRAAFTTFTRMRQIINITTTILFYFVLVSCNAVKTSYDYDLLVDFSKYHTYDFSTRSLQYQGAVNGPAFFKAVEHEMLRRGMKKSNDPDALLDLFVKTVTKEKTLEDQHHDTNPWASGYGMGFKTSNVNVEDYDEGTVLINMLDESQKKIIWQVRATKLLQQGKSVQKHKRNIDKVVAKMFAHYPYRMSNF
jgi:hypothetical protein